MDFDFNLLTSLIGSIGFPIVSFFLIFKELTRQNERHTEEINKLNSTIKDNTVVIQQLVDKMDLLK